MRTVWRTPPLEIKLHMCSLILTVSWLVKSQILRIENNSEILGSKFHFAFFWLVLVRPLRKHDVFQKFSGWFSKELWLVPLNPDIKHLNISLQFRKLVSSDTWNDTWVHEYGPRPVLKTSGTVFPNTDQSRPANNMYISVTLFVESRLSKSNWFVISW